MRSAGVPSRSVGPSYLYATGMENLYGSWMPYPRRKSCTSYASVDQLSPGCRGVSGKAGKLRETGINPRSSSRCSPLKLRPKRAEYSFSTLYARVVPRFSSVTW